MPFFKSFVAVLLLVTLPLGAAQAQHSHKPKPEAPKHPQCANPNPNPHCAKVATPALDPQGRLWLAWEQAGRVYVAASADGGASFDAARTINPERQTIDNNGDGRPKMAAGADGALYVSYTERLAKPFTGHIRFSRSLDGGATFSPPAIVNDNREEIGHRFDTLDVAPDGTLAVLWIDKRDIAPAVAAGRPYPGAALYLAVSTDRGARFSPNRKIVDNSCECCRLAIAHDRQGRRALLWRHVFGADLRDHALTTFLDAETAGPIRRVSFDEWHTDACPHHGPALAIDPAGVYHMAWFDDGTAGQGLFYTQSHDGGQTIGRPMAFGDRARQASHPALAAAGPALWLVWIEFDGQATALKAMRSADGGQSWSAPTTAAQGGAEADHPQLLVRGGRAYASWLSQPEGYRLVALEGRP
ncbi:MAG: exo-alpha-sialidase [Rhodospirillales bacterium]|nr:exo-alpha-sialidase [Rhodospirillales bacterium]